MQSKCNIRVGVIGHPEHGKTTLCKAIASVMAVRGRPNWRVSFETLDPDSDQANPAGAIQAAETESPECCCTLIDFPDEAGDPEDLFDMAGLLDGVILVVSAEDGAMPMTLSAVQAARRQGVSKAAVFINKCDLMDEPDLIDLIEMQIREILCDCGFEGEDTPVLRGSALEAAEAPDSYFGATVLELMLDIMEYFVK